MSNPPAELPSDKTAHTERFGESTPYVRAIDPLFTESADATLPWTLSVEGRARKAAWDEVSPMNRESERCP